MELPENELTCGFQVTHDKSKIFFFKGNFILTIDYKTIYKDCCKVLSIVIFFIDFQTF
jgi:hypothetical protein